MPDPDLVLVSNPTRQLVTVGVRNAVGVVESVKLVPRGSAGPYQRSALSAYTLQLARLGHATIRSA